MAWEERTVGQMGEEFVKRVLAREQTKAALCREYGISRPTGDKWIERFRQGEAMSGRNRAPKSVPGRIPIELEAEIARLRKGSPAIGAVKPRRMTNICHVDTDIVFVSNHLKRLISMLRGEILRLTSVITTALFSSCFMNLERVLYICRCTSQLRY